MSIALIKANIKANWVLFLMLNFLFLFYMFMIIMMYDPTTTQALEDMLAMLPQEFVKALGFETLGTTLLTFVAGYMYGFLLFLFPLILCVIVNHRLFAKMIDQGSMVFLVVSPISRRKIAFSQAIFSSSLMLVYFMTVTIISLLMMGVLFPSEFEIGPFVLLNLYAFLIYFTLSSIVYFISVASVDARQSLSFGVGVPVGFLFIKMLSDAVTDQSWIQYFTLYSLFNPSWLFDGKALAYISMGIFLIIGLGFYGLGIYWFNKKNIYV